MLWCDGFSVIGSRFKCEFFFAVNRKFEVIVSWWTMEDSLLWDWFIFDMTWVDETLQFWWIHGISSCVNKKIWLPIHWKWNLMQVGLAIKTAINHELTGKKIGKKLWLTFAERSVFCATIIRNENNALRTFTKKKL